MEKNPLVSICIPAYNAGKHIAAALDSVLRQSYKNIEIIVVNDGSTDNTKSILEDYNKKGVIVINQENQGQCVAANRAYAKSKGDYIKFFDADDLLSKDFIKNQINRMDGKTDIVTSAAWGRFTKNDLSDFKLNAENVWRDMRPIDWLVESLRDGPNMMQCALWLIPRQVLNRAGLWDERLSLINDFDFFIRILLSSQQVLFTENAILYYRSGINDSLSGQKSRKAYESAYLSTELGVKTIINFEDSERTRKVCADSFQLWKYQFYPKEIDLCKRCEEWIKKLGGSKYPFPSGGKTNVLCSLLGWKLTKRIKDRFAL